MSQTASPADHPSFLFLTDQNYNKNKMDSNNITSTSSTPEMKVAQDSCVAGSSADDPFISDNVKYWIEIVFFAILTAVVSFVGAIANIINIIIFCKQGFNDTVNISFLGLAIADLGSVLSLHWMGWCFNPMVRYWQTVFESIDIQYVTAGWPKAAFSRTSSWITVYIVLERCVCIAVPLKVKSIITAKRTVVVIVSIFILLFLSVCPALYSVRIGLRFYPERNLTLYGILYIENGAYLENISLSILTFTQICSFILVIIFTVLLIHQLFLKSLWRREATGKTVSGSPDVMSARDKRIMKTVMFISGIFITCNLPGTINILLTICFPVQYGVTGVYRNTFLSSWAIISVLDAINYTVNILTYYKISTKFRCTFNEIFGIGKA